MMSSTPQDTAGDSAVSYLRTNELGQCGRCGQRAERDRGESWWHLDQPTACAGITGLAFEPDQAPTK